MNTVCSRLMLMDRVDGDFWCVGSEFVVWFWKHVSIFWVICTRVVGDWIGMHTRRVIDQFLRPLVLYQNIPESPLSVLLYPEQRYLPSKFKQLYMPNNVFSYFQEQTDEWCSFNPINLKKFDHSPLRALYIVVSRMLQSTWNAEKRILQK